MFWKLWKKSLNIYTHHLTEKNLKIRCVCPEDLEMPSLKNLASRKLQQLLSMLLAQYMLT